MMFGLEIEFILKKEKLFKALQENNIPYVYYDRMKTPRNEVLVIKPEKTLKHEDGIEINFPPSDNYVLIEQVLKILNKLDVQFTDNCALHVHVGVNKEDVVPIAKYYIKHQEEIINEAGPLYTKLNKMTAERCITLPVDKFFNLNINSAFRLHGTVEHRIYKATLNLEEVKFCISQTLDIINKALNK